MTEQRDRGLVHGMEGNLVEPDFAPLTDGEVRAVLAHYPALAGSAPEAAVTWTSPRPMSAAGLVSCGGAEVFVKRHDPRVRSAEQLRVEHDFADHLRQRGTSTPIVLRTADGDGAVEHEGGIYEVHAALRGSDRYRHSMSWTRYRSPRHARAAGVALAQLHDAARGFSRPARPMSTLMYSSELIASADPEDAVRGLVERRPGLSDYLEGRSWPDDFDRHLYGPVSDAHRVIEGKEPLWAHGDWHPSNLAWDADGDAVCEVFDFGLCNRTFAIHDLANALERACVDWLEPEPAADTGSVDALLSGYGSVRPLSASDSAALAAVLPVVHVEFALSEIEYFHSVTRSAVNADLAYDGYLLGHADWFATPAGTRLLDRLRR